MCAITEAHDLERQKANEVLLFLLMDTDCLYNKDKPNSIPIAYGLEGRSLKADTARKMVTDVRNFLHHHNINVLAEVYDGQWSSLVFQDANDKPLTLFELQRDCWLKFIETLLKNSRENLDQWTSTTLNVEEAKRIGNIRVSLQWHTDKTQDLLHMQHCKSFITLESYCNEHNCEGRI